jgi:hypothetical protein
MSPHEVFPALTPEAERALHEADRHLDPSQPGWHRRYLAAFMHEAMDQSQSTAIKGFLIEYKMRAIANSLWSPPPLPPTLAEARAADLDTPEGKAVVRGFLATLGEGGQP